MFYSSFRMLMKIMLIFSLLFLASCLEVKQSININKDGSGDARMEIAVQKEVLSMPGGQQQISGMKAALQKEGWSIEGDKDANGKHFIIAAKKFKDISELSDSETKYVFSSEKKGFMKKSYALEVKQLKSSDMPFPYEISIKMPGSIDETSGNKISSDTAKWNLQGMRRGTNLSVKSSGFAMPDFASLKEAFNKAFNSAFYKEAIGKKQYEPPLQPESEILFTRRAVINDPDGYTNVRSVKSVSSDVVSKVYEGEEFYTYVQDGNWWMIRTKDGKVGYIHISRIKLIEETADEVPKKDSAPQPRVNFISPSLAKIIILVITAFIGISLLFGMALITRKAVKAITPKIPKLHRKESNPRSIFCSQCGKENPTTAKFCTGC